MRTLMIVALMAVGAAASSCGGSGDGYGATPTSPTSPNPSPNPNPGPASGTLTITITRQNGAQSFDPNPAEAGGRSVVFRNADTVVHRVLLNDGSVDTGNIAPNATSTAVLIPDTGTNYHCSLHPDMIGAVKSSAGGEPPTCVGIYC